MAARRRKSAKGKSWNSRKRTQRTQRKGQDRWGEAPERVMRLSRAAEVYWTTHGGYAKARAEPWDGARLRLGAPIGVVHLIPAILSISLLTPGGLSGASPYPFGPFFAFSALFCGYSSSSLLCFFLCFGSRQAKLRTTDERELIPTDTVRAPDRALQPAPCDASFPCRAPGGAPSANRHPSGPKQPAPKNR
jgi:hypothetical protein